jgi:hypothetical protein
VDYRLTREVAGEIPARYLLIGGKMEAINSWPQAAVFIGFFVCLACVIITLIIRMP